MKRGLVRSSRYSPGNMDKESLEALFVGRDSVMADVVKRLSDSVVRKGEKHYLLLVGPRGSGKPHFVALAYHRIHSELRSRRMLDRVLVAFLNEEEWGVASYLDFLVRILRALAVESVELADRISDVYTKFAQDPRQAESLAERLIVDHVRGKTLLLICENLIDLFEGLAEEGQRRWRSYLQETGFWAILATTPKLFAALTLPEHPFFGFFTIRELKALDYDTAHQFLVKKALHDEQPELAAFLSTPIGRARIRAIHHLAEGNHRAYVILYDFLDRQSLDDLVDPFMHMVDDLTPYYQDRMRQLAPALRKIVEFLCQRSEPLTVKEIASSCLMSQQTAAKQLGELEGAAFIKRTPVGRQTFCELAEPLMRICIEVKDYRTEHFRLFVEFLRHWFNSREIEQKVSVLESTHHSKVMDTVHFKEALRCAGSAATEPFIEALQEVRRRTSLILRMALRLAGIGSLPRVKSGGSLASGYSVAAQGPADRFRSNVAGHSGIVIGDSGHGRKSVTFERNERSRSAGTAGHVQAESAVRMVRKTHTSRALAHFSAADPPCQCEAGSV
jgi:DNA-binding transcriptional ArsR family regulator